MSVKYRLTIDQQHQLTVLRMFSVCSWNRIIGESGWTPNLATILTSVWTDKKKFDRVVNVLNREMTRMWLIQSAHLLGHDEFRACEIQAFGCELGVWHKEMSHDQLLHLKRLVTEKLELASVAKPARIPIPEETRLLLLRLCQESCIRESYVKLVQFFDHFRTPANDIGVNWHVDFANEADLKRFEEEVDDVERKLLIAQIWQASREYQNHHRRDELQKLVRTHFGSITNVPVWWKTPWISLADLRFYLAMLREPDLDKIKAMVRGASNYAAIQEEGEPDPTGAASAPLEPEMTMAERKAHFLHTVAKQPALIGPLASYMDQNTMQGIAHKVADNDDSVKFDEWESIATKADPGHIVWKIVDREISEVDKQVLIGFTPTLPSDRTIGCHILFYWSTFTDEKKELVNAYLDLIPKKK